MEAMTLEPASGFQRDKETGQSVKNTLTLINQTDSSTDDHFSLSAPSAQSASSVEAPFELELLAPAGELNPPHQVEMYLPEGNPEQPENSRQIEFDGMEKPVFAVKVSHGHETQQAKFQHATSLLESLEAQNVDVHYQCREGYCGSCRVELESGEVHYAEEPMAWINDNEILPCCCIPKSDLTIKKL